VRNQTAAVQLRQNPIKPEFLPKLPEAIHDHLRGADDDLVAQRFLIGNGLQALSPLGTLLDGARPRSRSGVFEAFAELTVKMHDAALRLRDSPFRRISDVNRQAQEDLTFAWMSSRFVGFAIYLNVRGKL
jgi:hypothetical protein